MLVTPALPWGAETTGGEITLQVPVTRQQLLDGAVKFGLTYHDHTDMVTAVMQNDTVKVRNNGAEYTVSNVVADNVEYASLTLVRTNVSNDSLVSVERVQPLPYLDPAAVNQFIAYKGYVFVTSDISSKIFICDWNEDSESAWGVTEYGNLKKAPMPSNKNELGSELVALYNNIYNRQYSFETTYAQSYSEEDVPSDIKRVPDTVSVHTLHSLPWSAQSSDSVLRLPADCSVDDILANKVKFYIGSSSSISVADVVSEGFDIALKVNGQTVYSMPKWNGLASEVAINHSAESNAYLYIARLAEALPVSLNFQKQNNKWAMTAVLQNGVECQVSINGVIPSVIEIEEGVPRVEITNQTILTDQLPEGVGSLETIVLKSGSRLVGYPKIDLLTHAKIDYSEWAVRLTSGLLDADFHDRGEELPALVKWFDPEASEIEFEGLVGMGDVILKTIELYEDTVTPTLPWSADVQEGIINTHFSLPFDDMPNYGFVTLRDARNNYIKGVPTYIRESGEIIAVSYGYQEDVAVLLSAPSEGDGIKMTKQQGTIYEVVSILERSNE